MHRVWFKYCICWYFVFVLTSAFLNLKLTKFSPEKIPKYASFVTPFLESGRIEEGQRNCSVTTSRRKVNSSAGFITVNKKYNSNLFFWFFRAYSGPESPVVLCLQGGPGSTSMYGIFEENGPFFVRPRGGFRLREHSWITNLSVLYIDNPVGTGFSFTNSDDGYAKNENDVAQNLLLALIQFFTLFPELQKNDFYITGESYAAKYVPALAYAIDKNNAKQNKTEIWINLKGIAIGNGFCDPEHMMAYGNYLFGIGLIDDNGRLQFNEIESKIVSLIQQKKFKEAFENFNLLMTGEQTTYKSLFYNLTGFSNYFNYQYCNEVKSTLSGDFVEYIQSDKARRVINVGLYEFNTDNKVKNFLINDIMQTTSPLIDYLIEKKYRVLIYTGQFDIIVAYPLTIQFLKHLKWPGIKELEKVERRRFIVNNKIAGYYRVIDNFIEVLVRNAGHMVPKDQPLWALELITRFTHNMPL